MARVVCLAYTAGEFAGVKFHEEVVDGVYVGVGETSDRKALAWFRARPGAFRVEGGGGKGAGKGDQPPAGDDGERKGE